MKTKTESPASTPPLWGVIAAFAAVYVIWGSTYLGIRYAIESIPPFLMVASRNIVAGLLLYAFALRGSGAAPTRIQWRDAAIAGGLLLVAGNGGVTWAEQSIPSGVAALIVALVPLWMVLMDWLRPHGIRPRPFVVAGLLVGFAGVVLIARGQGNHSGSAHMWGVIVVMLSSISWAGGSLFNRQAHKPASPLLGVSMQMIAAGVMLFGLSAMRGEFAHFSFRQITPVSAWAWVYLTAAGSLVGYSAYVWLLHHTTAARVSTYAYVNPFIAVLLGCTIGHETFSHELLMAGALIIVAVMLIVRGGGKTPVRPPAESA